MGTMQCAVCRVGGGTGPSTVSRRAKFVFIIEWVIISLFALGIIGSIIFYLVNFDKIVDQVLSIDPDLRRGDAEAVLTTFLIVAGVLGGVFILFEIGMNTLLTVGVNSRYHRYCKIWFIIQIVFFILAVIGFIFAIINIAHGNESAYSIIGYLISFLYRIITLFFIRDFMKELLEDARKGRIYTL